MADRNTYLKMMLNNGKTQNSSIPDVKDYVANLGLNDEDIADFLIKNNETYAKQVLSESQQQLQTQEQPLNQEKEEDKNWWQNIVDGMASIGNSVIDGIMNFADDIGDFFISVGDWMMGGNNKWADEAINYDWQAQVTNALNFMQPLLQGGDIAQNYNDWAQSIWQGGDTSREYLNDIVEGTWTDNDFGKFLRDAANSIGYMLPTIAVGVLTGGSSVAALTTMGVVAGMGQTSDAYQENNNMGLALLSGIVAGGIEAGTEAIGGFIPGSKTITKTTIKAIGKQMLEEGAEEVVSGFLQPVVDSIAKGNAEPWFDENGQFVYFTPEFWFTGEDSVARQGALGAFTGGVFGGANIVQNRIKYGKAGQQFGQAYQEFIETRNEARELKSKNKSTDAIEQKLGEASVYLAEKANELKTAIENGTISNRQVKNLGEMLHNPTTNRNLLAENLNENINQLNKTTNFNEHILRDLVSDFNISNNSNFKLDVVDDLKDANGNSVNAQFNENTNTISLNSSILDNNAYSVLGHELLAHGVLDNILTNSNTRSLVFNLVNNDTEWVNQNKQAILNEYNTTENSEIYKSELVANYLQEKLINNNSLSDLELLASNRGVFKEFINSAKLIMENTNSSRLKQQIRKAVRQFGKSNYRVNSIVLKMVNDKKLNSKEQEYYDQNKTLIDSYFDIINGGLLQETNGELKIAYSKDLNDVVDELIENSEKIETRIESDSQGEYVVYQNLDLNKFEVSEQRKIIVNFLRKTLLNTTLNIENDSILINNSSIKELRGFTKHQVNNAIIALKDIFKVAKFINEANSYRGDGNKYRYYNTRLKIGENIETFQLNILDNGNNYILHAIKNQSPISSRSPNSRNLGYDLGTDLSIDSISQENNSVTGIDNLNEWGNNNLYERTDEFRRLQEESRREFNQSSWEERSSRNDETLRRRLSNYFERELDSRGYNSSSSNAILLNSDKGTSFRFYQNVEPSLFHDIFEISRTYLLNGELVDLHDNYIDCKCFLSSDGLQGFAIEPNGNLVSVYNLDKSKKGFLSAISDIIKKQTSHLDCYVSPNQNLREMYEKKFGFKTASIMDYNMEYDHDNIAENHNMPQVAFMVNTNENVETKHFNKDQYDEAVEYQQSFINKEKIKYSKNLNSLTEAEKTSLSKLNKTIEENHKQKFLKVIRTKYFEGFATSPLIDKFTNRDIDYFEIATTRNLTSEEIASLDIYKYARDYTDSHLQLIPSEHTELVKQVETEFEDTILKQAIERNGGKELPRGRKLLYVTGLPGAGKSSGSVGAFLKENAAIEFDNDIAKAVPSLAEYYDGGLGANTVQQIVSAAQKNLLPRLLKEGYNIVYPAIGKKITKIYDELHLFEQANYNDRELIYVHVDNLTSQNRAFNRFISTGRFVDPIDYIKGIENGPELAYNQIEK